MTEEPATGDAATGIARLAVVVALLTGLAAADFAPEPRSAGEVAPMADAQSEGLVVLDPERAATARAAIEAIARVTQTLPPRLLLVVADRTVWERLLRVPGVHVPTTPDDLPADLTPAERAFAAAWAARGIPKARPGEGLDWDAPGYLPPDAPPDAGKAGGSDRDPGEPER